MNDPHDLGRRDERPTLLCVNCGRPGQPTAKNHGSTDLRQSWCDECRNNWKKVNSDTKARRADDARDAAVEAKEQREVMTLLHERGRHETLNDRCPLCTTAASSTASTDR